MTKWKYLLLHSALPVVPTYKDGATFLYDPSSEIGPIALL